MSEDSAYHSPSPADEDFDLSEIIRFNAEFDQQSVSTSAQPTPWSTHSYGPTPVFSPSSDLPWQKMGHGDPFDWSSNESYSGGSHSSTCDQSITLGSPLSSSGQPQSVNDEPPIMTPEFDRSMILDSLEQIPPELSASGVSAGDTFEVEVSQASASDRDELIEIYARASIEKPLNCCIVKRSSRHSDIEGHQAFGKFHYDQALHAAKTDALVLKATKTTSGEIVGCAWLQLHNSLHANVNGRYKLGAWLPSRHLVEHEVYKYVHRQIHKQRQNAIQTHHQIIGCYGPHCFIRSLDLLETLTADNHEKVLRKLISFISEYDPDQEVFTWLSETDLRAMKVFLDQGWVETEKIILGPPETLGPSTEESPNLKDCPKKIVRIVVRILGGLDMADRTLRGYLRPKRVHNSGSAPNG